MGVLVNAGAFLQVSDRRIRGFLHISSSLAIMGAEVPGSELLRHRLAWRRARSGTIDLRGGGCHLEISQLIILCRGSRARARLTAQEHNDSIRLGWDESEEEDILGAAVVTFENRVTESRLRMELDLLVAGTDEVVDDVRRCRVRTGTAEPLVASETL